MNLKAAENILAKITTPEAAQALKGAAKESYMKALEVVHGPIEQRMKALGFDAPQVFNPVAEVPEAGKKTGAFFTTEPGQTPVKINRKGTVTLNADHPEFNYGTAKNTKEMLKHDKNVTIKGLEGPKGMETVVVKDPSSVRSIEAAYDPRFRASGNIMAGVAPVASMNPLDLIGQGVDAYKQHVVEPVRQAFSKQVDLTGGQMESDPVWKAATSAAVDPTTYIPGAVGAGVGAIQAMAPSKEGYAEGGEVIPEGAIPIDQFEMAAQPHMMPMGSMPEGAIPVDDFVSAEEHYGSPGQQAIAGLEGLAEGIAGPLAPLAEKHILGVPEEDILGRREENPITFGAGQAAGLIGSTLSGVGAGAAMTKAGLATAEAVGLGARAAETASLGFKVGSSAVTQAAEMAVLSGSDEVSKMILNDPDTSAESAIANIGLASALGGAGGAFITGAISPLWNATAGPHVENMLKAVKNHLDGGAAIMPAELKAAQQALGLEIKPEIQAALSGNPTAVGHFNILKEGQHRGITEGIEQLNHDLADSVSRSLRIDPSDVAVHSENAAGHDLLEAFKKEYKAKYEPISEALEKRNAEAAKIMISDDARLDKYGKLLEEGMTKVGTDSPTYKLYNDWGNRILAKETVGGIDMLKTELSGEIEKALRAGDTNSLMALRDIRSSLSDFQESQIAKQAAALDAKDLGAQLLNERAETNRMYKEFAQMSGELTDHLGVGRFRGAGSLAGKLTDAVSPEQLLNKFSIKGNADFIPFLQKNFPEVYEKVRENELKRLLKPAVLSAKGEAPINIKKLNDIIEKGMAGQKEYIEAVLPPEAIQAITAANKIHQALPNPKSSGTAGWMTKMYSDMPRSAMAGVAMIAGHSPIAGGLIGEMAMRLGRDVPDALRLAHLKWLGSDQPIKAEGFKAMVDFFHNTYKGETMLAKSVKNVFVRGAQVITASQMPNKADREKLDKIVTRMQDNPESLAKSFNGQTGYYLPNHQTALATASTRALQYLGTLKPQPHVLGPLDKPVDPLPIEEARYNRALDIAQTPAIVLQHVKDGTIMQSDIADLNAMYPGLYKQMVQKLTGEMNSQHADGEPIPYHTRIGLALLTGTPVDSTMTPMAIMSAQPKPTPPPSQGGAPKSMKSLGKSIPSSRTPGQAAEAAKANRD